MKKIIATIIILGLLAVPVSAAVDVLRLNYKGDCNAAYITVSSGTITLDIDQAKGFNVSVRGYTVATLDINATNFTITRDTNTTNTDYNLSSAQFNTIGKLIAALESRDDIEISVFDTLTYDVNSAKLTNVSSQDVNGTTKYTATYTTQDVFTISNIEYFGALDAEFNKVSLLETSWASWTIERRRFTLPTGTLHDLAKTDIKGTPATLAAGGTYDDTYAPFFRVYGTIDEVLFCLNLYRPNNWYVVDFNGTRLDVIGGP